MAWVDPTTRFRDGLEMAPNPYLRWGMVEGVYEEDILHSQLDETGTIGQEIPIAFARSVKIRWLHHAAGRTVVKFVEPWGVTSMPMKGSVAIVGFVGGPGGEPVILGFWSQGYPERISSGEIGDLLPGQEVWRRSGMRFRIIPYLDDLRKYPEQYMKSPWTLDLIMGEQHDEACFCAVCQTRFPATRETQDGTSVLTCPAECPICAEEGRHTPLTLVKGSVAAGAGDTWLAAQASLLTDLVFEGTYRHIDENVLGEYLEDVSVQQQVRGLFRRYLYQQARVSWGADVVNFYQDQLVSYWEDMLREYFTVGNLLNYSNDFTGVIDSSLVSVLQQSIDGWVQTQLFYYLTDKITSEQRAALIGSIRENLKTYMTEVVPALIEEKARRFIDLKARTYLSETIARLRRKAVSWVYKNALKAFKDALVRSVKDQLKTDFGGLRRVRDAVAEGAADLLRATAELDLVNLMDKLIKQGLEDPEELPVFELRGDQDLRAVANLETGREEGQGLKASRFRLKLYRDGELRLQIQDKIFVTFASDGSVELLCDGPLDVAANQLYMGLDKESFINIDEAMNIGRLNGDMKKVTLDEDNVREYDPGLVGQSTRNFIEKVAWKYIAGQLANAFTAAAVAPGDGGTTLKGNMALALGSPTGVSVTLQEPPDDSIIGKTDASADHLKGN